MGFKIWLKKNYKKSHSSQVQARKKNNLLIQQILGETPYRFNRTKINNSFSY